MTQVAERSNGAVAHPTQITAAVMESVLIGGDLSKLSQPDRLNYYKAVCESVGLNPLTKPFAYIQLNGKLQLYALKDCTEQLRKIHGVSIERIERQVIEGCYVVTAYAKDKTGRTDGSTGAVSIGSLKGEALANAYMKAETKAKRRVTLSICGLGMLDETEAASIPGAQIVSAEIQQMPEDEAAPAPEARPSDRISPTVGAMETLPPAEQMELGAMIDEVREAMNSGTAEEALDLLESFKLEDERRVAAWSLLDSHERRVLKAAAKRKPGSTL